jgi:hypothetical protein
MVGPRFRVLGVLPDEFLDGPAQRGKRGCANDCIGPPDGRTADDRNGDEGVARVGDLCSHRLERLAAGVSSLPRSTPAVRASSRPAFMPARVAGR